MAQSQAIRGSPWLVPEPRIRTRSSPASGPGSPGSKPGSRPSGSWSRETGRRVDDAESDGASGTTASDRIPSAGRRTTTAGPPAATRSSASFASASAARFSDRGTCRALQRRNRPRRTIASAWSGASLASFTRQRPLTCSTISFESRRRDTSSAPSSSARARARRRPVYSATLLVWRPSASETVASGEASGRSAPGRSASIRTAPADAGPGLPRAAPSVRMISAARARGRSDRALHVARETSRMARVMLIPRGQASTQLKSSGSARPRPCRPGSRGGRGRPRRGCRR